MAKMTKAAARKRIKEAERKLVDVAVAHPDVISFPNLDKLLKLTAAATRKLK